MSAAAMPVSARQLLQSIVGPAYVFDEESVLAGFDIDRTRAQVLVRPADEQEVAAVLRACSEADLVVVPAVGATQTGVGRTPERIDVILETCRLNAIEHYDPGDLTIGVGAGANLEHVRSAVRRHQQLLPLDVSQGPRRSIGGVLATSAQGPLSHHFGTVREFCIGIRFVTGDGRIGKAGGRVVKNVAGYDMMKLLIGSYGTLGVITAANFKVFPAPRNTRTFLADFNDLGSAIEFRNHVMRSPLSPLCLDIISPQAHAYLVGDDPELRWTVAVVAAGSDSVLRRYTAELGSTITSTIEAESERTFWHSIAEFEHTVARVHQNAIVAWVNIPPSAVDSAMAIFDDAADRSNFMCCVVGRCASASLTVGCVPLPQNPPVITQYVSFIADVRSALQDWGSVTVVSCPVEAKAEFDVWGAPRADLEVMRSIKRALDPANILNRGRYVV